ncbi:hypothetical protein ADUPG1_011143 [Aduncisulcus paluster]|uniref:Uncharacterized protein n=1 Tax=Aduncisulcus paluster TaxID=2918883 RepID=A0ABQ5JUV0_9EUKA|nr:hypothetical protein ADUPG1_011143 [Aduncisulcus paluster]
MTTDAMNELIFLGLEPWFDDFMGTFSIPDFSTTLDFGVGKASISLNNFDITSYSFFPSDEVSFNTIPSENLIFLQCTNAGAVATVDYDVKLLTYPYSRLSGSAQMSIGDFGLITSLEITKVPDYDDTTCHPDAEACGYLPEVLLPDFKLVLQDVVLTFIGDTDPILEMISDLIDSAFIPFLTNIISASIVEYWKENPMSAYFGLYSGYYLTNDSEELFLPGYAQAMIIGDGYMVFPMYSMCISGDTSLEQDNSVFSGYNPPADLPYAAFDTELQFTVALDNVRQVFYNTINNANKWFNGWQATFDTIACVPTRNGCQTSSRWTGGDTSAYVIQNNLGRDIDNPPSSLSPLFTSRYWEEILPDLYALCPNCYIDINTTFQTPDGVPAVPSISMRLDGLDLVYSDYLIKLNMVHVDDGSSVASVDFSFDLSTDCIVWSDHAYFNFLQNVATIDGLTIESCSNSTEADSDHYYSDSDTCGIDISSWNTLVNVLLKVFLDNFFQVTFKQDKRCFQYVNRIPIGWWYVSTIKNEEVYYMPDNDCFILTAEFDECDCEPKCFDDKSRRDDGTTYCISQLSQKTL